MTVETQAGGVLSSEDRERFAREGFLVIDDPCAPELVDELLTDSQALYHDAFDPGPNAVREGVVFTRHVGGTERYHWHRVKDAWKARASIRKMAMAPRVLAITEELFGRRVLPFQTLNFPMGTEQDAHIDGFYFNSDPNGFMCGVWIALEDMDMDNGPLVYYPRSQRFPIPEWSEIAEISGIDVDQSGYPSGPEFTAARLQAFSIYCEHMIGTHDLEAQYGTIRKGQALIWAANLLHGGAPQRDKGRTRHSQVTHYYFEGCRHYKPFQTEGEYSFWSYPEWVREPPPATTIESLKEVIEGNLPAGSTTLVASSGYEALLELDDRRAWPFPQTEDGSQMGLAEAGPEAVTQLESLRSAGAEYVVFPKGHLEWLEYHAPELQNHLENRYREILRDGAYCAIYALNGN
jgi:ectoine hydroxylase-related dioxygenase (phytanoyl-CoA dioxygenase family)